MKIQKRANNFIKKYFKKKLYFTIFIGLAVAFLVTRFLDITTRSNFNWDQIDNAWAVKNIVVEHKVLLTGMQAKGNTGFYIGPYYYYFIVPFYLLTNLDPIASPIIAGVTALMTFLLLYFVIRDIFDERVALVALFFDTFSNYVITTDRVQWPVNFIVPVSLLVFYALFKILNGNYRYILLLAAAFGFSLHIHFTSIFYIPIILGSSLFFPRKKQTIYYVIYSVPILLFFLTPIIIATIAQGKSRKPASQKSWILTTS